MSSILSNWLLAALFTLPFVSASGFLPPTDLNVISCSIREGCNVAAAYWDDCFDAHVPEISADVPIPLDFAQVHCLCPSTITSVPSHRDWSENLLACVQCIEDASGTNADLSTSLTEQKRALCRGDSGISTFVHAVRDLGSRAGFPLSLPDVQLKAHLDLRSISDDSCHPEHRCDHDDCLRQCIQESTAVNSFCATYTQSVDTCTTSLPAFVSHCGNSPARISSACSCLPSVTTTQIGTGALSKSNSHSTSYPSSNGTASLPSSIKSPSASGITTSLAGGTATSPSSPSGAAPTTSVASQSSVASQLSTVLMTTLTSMQTGTQTNAETSTETIMQTSTQTSNSTTSLVSTSTETSTETIIETQTRSVMFSKDHPAP